MNVCRRVCGYLGTNYFNQGERRRLLRGYCICKDAALRFEESNEEDKT